MDYEEIAADLVRALRGKRSQTAFCRRLGYKSNVVYSWESKRGWPTAAKFLWAAGRVGVDVDEAFRAFYRSPPAWLSKYDPATPEGVAAFLDDLRGHTSLVELAQSSGKNRFAISRWLKGKTEPKLPEFLMLIECSSLRLLDFLEQLVDPRQVPSVAPRWEELQVARRVAYDAPWSQAVLRALELESYAALPKHELGWIAQQVGISRDEEVRCLKLLSKTGQIRFVDEHWVLDKVMALDTRSDPEAAQRLKAWWGDMAVDRVRQGTEGFMYNLFGVSRADLKRLRELQKAYLIELRTIVAKSEPVECVALATTQLLELTEAHSTSTESAPRKPR